MGIRCFFWHYKWCGEQSLKVHFPNLFKMATLRNATVEEVLSWNVSLGVWHISFTRSPNDWAEESILSLLALLANSDVDVQSEGNDKII